jgi:hypothetical protein
MIEGISRAPEQGRAGRGAVTIDALDISSHSFLCGLIDLSTTGFGGVAGPYSIFYQIILRDGNHFTTVWRHLVVRRLDRSARQSGCD